MARQIARSVTLATATIVGGASLALAQPANRGGPNPNAPRLMVSACRTADKALALLCADKIRSQIEGDVSFRSLYVMPKTDVENTLTASGYDPGTALAAGDANALAKQIRADVYFDMTVEKAGAGYRVNAGLVLQRDANMIQPLGNFEHVRIEGVASAISRTFQDVHNKVFEDARTCFTMVRERKYAEANKAINDGLKGYPNSTWVRYCKLGMLRDQKGDAAEITKLAEEIRALDPQSKPALQELVTRYDAAGNKEKKIDALLALQKADPTNPRLNADIANELAGMGDFTKARPIIEKAVADNPGDMNLIRTYWNVLTALSEFKKAMEVGDEMVKMDSAAADTNYFQRTIQFAIRLADTTKAADIARGAGVKFPNVMDFPRIEASLWLALKKNVESMAAARRVLAINPKEPNIRVRIASAFLDATPPQIDSAIAMAKEMIANGEDKLQVAGVAVKAGDVLRKIPDQLKASGADAATQKAAWVTAYAELAWADTLAKGTSVAPQAKFLMGVAALSIGQAMLTSAGEGVTPVTDRIRAMKPMPDAAAQKAMLDKPYAEACQKTNAANDYLIIAQVALPAGGSFAPDQTRQIMGSLMSLNGYVEQMQKAYCKK